MDGMEETSVSPFKRIWINDHKIEDKETFLLQNIHNFIKEFWYFLVFWCLSALNGLNQPKSHTERIILSWDSSKFEYFSIRHTQKCWNTCWHYSCRIRISIFVIIEDIDLHHIHYWFYLVILFYRNIE